MKKELFAVALLLTILGLSLWNTYEIRKLCGQLETCVTQAGGAAQSGDWQTSEDRMARALDLWLSRETYAQTVLRHTDIETLTDDFYELLEHIYTQDPGAVKSAVSLVTEHLQGIAKMESIQLGSIF